MKPLLPFLLVCVGFWLCSCEEPYTPETVFEEPELVVEGYVEYGDEAMPPYVILTKSYNFSNTISANALNNLFVRGADVRVSDGQQEVQLTEVCLADLAGLDTALQRSVAQAIGLGGADLSQLNFCIYLDVSGFLGTSPLTIAPGRSYTLRIRTQDGKEVNALTTLVAPVPMDTFFWANHPGYPANDSLVELRSRFSDPVDQENYYRIFTRRNNEPMYPASSFAIGSVTDDKIFNGQAFVFPVQRGQNPTAEFDITTAGYFWRGDTITIRGASLDRAHFRFWQTLEYNAGSQGPFGTYVRIQSNVQGALGIWGGISYRDYQVVIR
jgi:hypothetical protein